MYIYLYIYTYIYRYIYIYRQISTLVTNQRQHSFSLSFSLDLVGKSSSSRHLVSEFIALLRQNIEHSLCFKLRIIWLSIYKQNIDIYIDIYLSLFQLVINNKIHCIQDYTTLPSNAAIFYDEFVVVCGFGF